MITTKNRFGELETIWTSHKHPNNPNFMQLVKYMHITKPDGKTCLYWSLFNASSNDNHIIPNISLEDAVSKYTDIEVHEVTESEYQKWLKEKSNK